MSGFDIDHQTLDDLVEVARIMRDANDIEPWAAVYHDLYVNSGFYSAEDMHWVIALHNSYDAMSSAWKVFARWPSPWAWRDDPRRDEAYNQAVYPIMTERRNLFGGKVLRRHSSYLEQLGDKTQDEWLSESLLGITPEIDFQLLMARTREVWGVGRQSAFEWAEFLAKVLDYPVHAPHAELWESSGPRKSLERLYGNPNPDVNWLNDAANHARGYLADAGVHLEWEDFETVICDFNVMRDGRYYPGQHLAFLKEEIIQVDDSAQQAILWEAWGRLVPEKWQDIPPGINHAYRSEYASSRFIRSHA